MMNDEFIASEILFIIHHSSFIIHHSQLITQYIMVKITVIDREDKAHELDAPTDMAMNLMELCKAYELPVEGTCGGMALCSTCHCYVQSENDLPEPSEAEEDMLDQAFFVEDNSRLGCQLQLTGEMEGLVVKLAPTAG
jgi:ferredoxin